MDTALMKNKTKIEKQSANKAEMSSSELMSVSELGRILGLKKTDRYWLIHKEFFETRMYLGKMWVVRESFEKWYAGQVKYHKVNGEEPGADLKKSSYSARDIAGMLAINEATAYEIIKREHLETIEVDYWRRVPKEAFDRWYRSQHKYRNTEDRERDAAAEAESITMPEMARLLGITRARVYTILKNDKYSHFFEFTEIAGQKRILRKSFDAFLDGQEKYYLQMGSEKGKLANHRKRKLTAGGDKVLRNIGNRDYLTIEEAGILAGVTRPTVAKWIRNGYFPSSKAGGSVRIRRQEFGDWLAEKKRK